jgi:hypothetical protein
VFPAIYTCIISKDARGWMIHKMNRLRGQGRSLVKVVENNSVVADQFVSH